MFVTSITRKPGTGDSVTAPRSACAPGKATRLLTISDDEGDDDDDEDDENSDRN